MPMTREQILERRHTWQGPVTSVLTTLVVGGIMFALAYSGKRQAVSDIINDHEKRLTAVEQTFKSYLSVQQERDIRLEGRLSSIETEIKISNRRRTP